MSKESRRVDVTDLKRQAAEIEKKWAELDQQAVLLDKATPEQLWRMLGSIGSANGALDDIQDTVALRRGQH